jgi:hypothetical protein
MCRLEKPGTVHRHPVAGGLEFWWRLRMRRCGEKGEKLALAPNPVPVDGSGRRGTNCTPPGAGARSRDPVDCSNGTGWVASLTSLDGIAEIAEI